MILMEGFSWIFLFAICGFILFLIIAGAVKMAVKEALYEFKEDIVKEFNLKKAKEDNKDEN